MTKTELDIIEGIWHNDQLLLPLDGRAIKELFGSDKISFQATLIDDRIVLTSPRIKSTNKGPSKET